MARGRIARRMAVVIAGTGVLAATTLVGVPAGAEPGEAPGEEPAGHCLHAADVDITVADPVIPWQPDPITTELTVTATGQAHCVSASETELKVTVAGPWQGAWVADAGELRVHEGTDVWGLPPLEEGETATLTIPVDFPTPLLPNAWSWEAVLRSSNDVYERAWADATVTPTCSDVWLGATIVPKVTAEGRPTAASVTATNQGSCDLAFPITVRVWGGYLDMVSPTVVDGGTLVGDQWTITSLAPGETASISWAGTAGSLGVHELRALFDLAGDPSIGNYAYDNTQVSARPALAGFVTGFDGAPVGGARVAAFWAGGGWFPAARATTTAADGSYRLDLPQGGVYKVLVTDPTDRFHRHWLGGGESRRESPGIWAVPGVLQTQDVVLMPRATQALDVDVTGPDGAPRSKVWVTVFDEHGYVAGAVTDADGRALVGDLAADWYWVRAWPLDGTTPAEWYLDSATRAGATAVPLPIGTMPVSIQLDA